MNLHITEGCIAWAQEVDHVDLEELTQEQKEQLLHELVKIVDINDFDELFEMVVKNHGEYTHSDSPCDECGDWICEWDLNI